MSIYFQTAPQLVIENGAPAAFSGQALTGTYASNATYLGEHENHHYYMIQNGQTWTTAKAAAEVLGGYLAIPNDAAENQAIENMVSNKNVREDAWFGIYWNGTQWIDVLGNTPTYTNWLGSTTNTAQNNSYDDHPYAMKDYWNTTWHNQWKGSSHAFIIEFAPSDLPVAFGQDFCDSVELKAATLKTSDSPGFDHIYWTMQDANGVVDTINDGAYFTFTQDADVTLHGVFTRSDGEECIISSVEKSIDIFLSPSLTFSTYDSLNNQHFIGSNILACSETNLFTTVSANSNTSNVFTYTWSTGESDSLISSDALSHATVTVTDVKGCTTTDSLSIFKKSQPIISKRVVSTDTSMSYYNTPYIPNFYYQGQIGNNYIYSSSYSTTWSQAHQDALALGGDLASFSTESEYNVLTSWAWNDHFVGLNDSITENVWQFSDGTPVTYLPPSWGQGEPNNSGNEDYITISYYNFNDIGESSQYPFFLQIPVPPTEVPIVSEEEFCDSITLIATEVSTEDSTTLFSKVYWKDAANGAVIDSSGTLKVTSSVHLYLEGYFDQSNGTECSILGDTIIVIINETPDLTVYSADSTYELVTDTMNLIAYSNTAGANISWQVDTNVISSDTLSVFERGLYTATATLNGCSISDEIFIERPIFVAKTGDDINGNGTFANPYLTIQKGVNEAASEQKIYVLPGIYSETVDVDKTVTIESDFVRLDNTNAKNTTIIDGNGDPCISIDNVSDDIVVTVNGFKLRDASQTSNANQGAIHIKNSSNTTFSLRNSSITQSANSGDCCGRGGIINVQTARRVEFVSVDINNNGSLTQGG